MERILTNQAYGCKDLAIPLTPSISMVAVRGDVKGQSLE